MRYFLIFFISLFCCVVNAQEPKVTVSITEQQPLVGQVTTVKVKVLVPTWFSKPLYFDEAEAINIINIKGNKSTYPTSERVDGATWTGVIKEYPIIAMAQGKYELQLPTLNIHFVDDNNNPVKRAITVPKVEFNASLPTKAASLSPVIIAENITLTEQLKTPEQLVTGQSIHRVITAEITTSSALFIPPLLATQNTELAQAYPASVTTTDKLDQRSSELLGTRIEQQDILIKQDGQLELAAIELQYYQPSTDTIKTATIDGQVIAIKPPAMTSKRLLLWLITAAIAVLVLYFLIKVFQRLRQRYQQTETAYFSALKHSAKSDIKAYYRAYLQWSTLLKGDISKSAALLKQHQAVVISFEQAIYTQASLPVNLKEQIASLRANIKHSKKANSEQLSPLNP